MNRNPFSALMVMVSAFLMLLLSANLVMADTEADDDYVPNWTNYQGYVTDSSGQPLNGKVDLYFAIYDSESDGNKLWSQYHDQVDANGGYFYVKLGGDEKPLGYGTYENDDRYVEVHVSTNNCRPNCTVDDEGQYEKLPRQQIGTVPYALKAHRAYSATWASKVHWNNIQGKPAGNNNGGGEYKYVITVAKEGGHYTSIYDAVQSVSDASKEKQYLIWVAPGRYEETETIVTKPYVHIHGADPYATHIYNFTKSKTLVLQSYVSLRDLSIHNYYNGERSYAIYANSSDYEVSKAWLYYIYAYAGSKANYNTYRSDYHYGFYASGSVNVHMKYVYAYGDYGKQYNYGAYLANGARLYAKNSHFYGYYGQYAYGVYLSGSGDYNGQNKTYFDGYYVKAWAKYGSDYNYGYYAQNGGDAKVYNSHFYGYYGEGYGQKCYGVYNDSSRWEAHQSYGKAHNCTTENAGLYNRYGPSTLHGGIYNSYVDSQGGNDQYCYGVNTGGNNGSQGWLAAYDVVGKSHNCYYNYGFQNAGGGHAETYGGTYSAEGGYQSFGMTNAQANSYHKAERGSAWGKGGSNNNVGYYSLQGANAHVDGYQLHGGTYSVYHQDNGGFYAAQTKFDGSHKWPGGGTFKCYSVYNASYDAVTCSQN
ncbi:MAG: hypothetical protein AAF702_07140 [Chloroflexota bacterium]